MERQFSGRVSSQLSQQNVTDPRIFRQHKLDMNSKLNKKNKRTQAGREGALGLVRVGEGTK